VRGGRKEDEEEEKEVVMVGDELGSREVVCFSFPFRRGCLCFTLSLSKVKDPDFR